MEILSPGRKIKMLRNKIGLRQDQLTDDKITRSLISMIENGKRSLNQKTALIIAEKLNLYYKNIGKEITLEYLLEKEEQQAEKIINDLIKTLQPFLLDKKDIDDLHVTDLFNKAISLSNDWKLDCKLAEVLNVRGVYNLEFENYNDALMDFFNSVEFYLKEKNYSKIVDLYIKIAKCYLMLDMTIQAVFFCDKAYAMADTYKTSKHDETLVIAICNKIISFKRANKYDHSLKSINQLKGIRGVREDIMDWALYMEAASLLCLKNYDKSIKLLEKLLNKENRLNSKVRAFTFMKVACYYIEKGNRDSALSFLNDSKDIINNLKYDEKAEALLELSEEYFKLEEINKALDALDEGINLNGFYFKSEIFIDMNILYSRIYMSLQNYDLAINFLKEAEALALKKYNIIRLKKIYCYFGDIFSKLKEYEACEEYFKKIRNI
ncbi:helix-turn-helix domain-containing protein [Alkaliphilus peptidifermentans]|uniref:Tetratricopeptide repeat-containing protein n=1 Tax=Alkaliphilus peptidifermentans DSM 18978 TaxID=1120976 RepID=A0A1G5KED3_9FIRM|nr:helix-turn-helix transcriptional regulator [Alkaliphilus peptidifermentans]SCY98390.1 Tetratricopeptide repeat-containing protein [Alkaliphilus peptidifermentans DSM 18978]